jgi:peptidoglycan hydrolase-like protein with peptidoglycan-binding domain
MGDEKVKAAQQALKDKGHDPGSIDGKMGPKTQAALRDFQKAEGMEATGRLDMKTMQSLGMEGGKTSSAGGSTTSGSASPATSTDAPKDASGAGSPATAPATDEKKTEEKK